jgi:hypothetical protein
MRISSRGTVHCRSVPQAVRVCSLQPLPFANPHAVFIPRPRPLILLFSCCSAPDTTRDFARIGDFLKNSSSAAQGAAVGEKTRPQTQAGAYKVVAPWDR